MSRPTLVRSRRVLIVANPAAGWNRNRAAGESALRAARYAGLDATLSATDGPGHASEIARQASGSGYDLVVAAGGDGTAHEVANGLAGSDVALGVAPAGTMNLLARSLSLPLDPAASMAILAEGFRPLRARPGAVGDRIFLLMAGAGFDAWVLRELLAAVRRKIRFRDYVRGALSGLRTFRFDPLSVGIDGAAYPAHTAIIGRAPMYGGFLRPTPHVRWDRDELEVCALSGNAARLALSFPRLWSGAHAELSGVTLTMARQARLTAMEGAEIPYHLDGELAGTLPVTVELSERRIVLATTGRVP